MQAIRCCWSRSIAWQKASAWKNDHYRYGFLKDIPDQNWNHSIPTNCTVHYPQKEATGLLVKDADLWNYPFIARHSTVNEELKTRSFITHPHTSPEKGTAENKFGVRCRLFPKKTDYIKVTAKVARRVEKMLNERPLRKSTCQTPNAVI
jgi:hypothetical protein